MLPSRSVWIISVLLCTCFAGGITAAERAAVKKKARPKSEVLLPVVDQPDLPRVLLIGDSISMGYTLPVRKLLAGGANVHRPLTNCGPTTRGLEQMDEWLGDKPWTVIHFNWGLHDLKYVGPPGETLADPKAPDSRQQVPPAQYEVNLRKLVQRLKQSGAKLIWCSTTPVPEGAAGRVPGDEANYNAIAAKIMQENGVAINDLCAAAKPPLDKLQLPANVHFTADGYEQLAKEVARSIREALR